MDPENLTIIQRVEEKNNTNMSTVVNDLIKKSHNVASICDIFQVTSCMTKEKADWRPQTGNWRRGMESGSYCDAESMTGVWNNDAALGACISHENSIDLNDYFISSAKYMIWLINQAEIPLCFNM